MFDRRRMLAALAGSGVGTAVFHRALIAQVDPRRPRLTSDIIRQAEWITGTRFHADEHEQIAQHFNDAAESLTKLRAEELAFDDLPAVHFKPLGHAPTPQAAPERAVSLIESRAPQLTQSDEELAFLPVTELSALIRTRQITSEALTQLYIDRLRRFDPLLKFVVNLTEDLAMRQARQADEEIAAGRYRGVLHGIPWGAKDLISVPGYPTTWGMPQFRDRVLPQTATVAQRLREAGAVLVAKLSLGAIAMGDKWFGGMTRNPWNPAQGSSGSSAGSASATAAGCAGFSLGSETHGSIISPSRRCGATGLRPTFGRVSRHGCMPLSWSMDKIGPICRGVEDCALVFAAIHGWDGLDPTAEDWPFTWPPRDNLRGLRVGFVADDEREREDLRILKDLGCQPVEVTLPNSDTLRLLGDIVDVEAAAVFDQMLRAGEIEGWNSWPRIFRNAQFLSAIDYLRFMRKRRQLMFEMEEVFRDVDVLVNADDLLITNLTGHPSVALPNGFREQENRKVPSAVVFSGRLRDESRLLALAHAYQQSITAHLQRPPLEQFLSAAEAGQ